MAGNVYKKSNSQWQKIVIQKFARNENIKCATFSELQKCKSLFEEIIHKGMADSRLKLRVRAARMLQITRDENADGNHTPRPLATTQENSAKNRADDICADHEVKSSRDDEMEAP